MLDSAAIALLTSKFIIGGLIFIRITGMMVSAPIFRNVGIPTQVKIMLAVLLAIVITTSFWKEQPAIEFHLWNMTFLVLKEFMVGMIVGFAANTVFYAARLAGGLIDTEMGYQTSALFDPENANPTLLGEVKELIVVVIFLIINGHHYLIEAMFASFRAVPIQSFGITETTIHYFVKMATSMLMIGIKLSSPILLAMFITNLSLALLARVAPQTNIFALSFQFKVSIGLVMLFISIPIFVMVAKFSLSGVQTEIMEILLSLNPARVY
jgi:flagellar biosynthetic protein FliR